MCASIFYPQDKKIHPLKIVSRYRDPQFQVGENHSYLFNLRTDISFVPNAIYPLQRGYRL